MINLDKFGLTDLLLARQFLADYVYKDVELSAEHALVARNTLNSLIKEIWARLVSNNTPWGVVEPKGFVFEDKEFEKTLEDVSSGKFDVEGEIQNDE